MIPEDWVHVGIKRMLEEEPYADPVMRKITEKECVFFLDIYLRKNNLSMVDSPSGKWQRVEIGEEDPWVYWEYRLHGYAIQPSQIKNATSSTKASESGSVSGSRAT